MGFGWSTLDFGFQCRQPIPMGFFATSSGGVAAAGLHRSAICRDGSDVDSKTRQGHFRCLAQDYRLRIVGYIYMYTVYIYI